MAWLALGLAALAVWVALSTGVYMVSAPSNTVQAMAQLIAQQEGFGVPGAIPTDYHNPGDLTNWPGYPTGDRGQGNITIFPDDATGWKALYTDLTVHLALNPNQSLDSFIQSYAEQPPGSSYAQAVAQGLGVSIDTPLSQISTANG